MASRPIRNKVATAVSLALAVTSGSAYAQDDDDASMEEIVVTGKYRASLIDSIYTKRNSTSIVEAISAEDIGKLPDSSIAEAISRLPGLAGQRLDGRTSSISIRGLGEDFSTATLNGREQVSISDNRGIEFDLYPSEIMSGVTVYKTPEASLMT
jgi:iron complex outermembrane receptor protein